MLEHVIPESLGGDHEGASGYGLVCSACNNYFGSKVEEPALSSFPFNIFRVMASIVTKKGRYARSRGGVQGDLGGTPWRNVVEIFPRSDMWRGQIEAGRVTQSRVLAEVTDAQAVCRLLLKMGCEHLATFDASMAGSERVAEARRFARAPRRGDCWWFLLLSDPTGFDNNDAAYLDVSEVDGALAVHFHANCFDLIAPMASDIQPSADLEAPPESRLYRVTI